MFSIKGKNAIVTGGSKGLGLAMAIGLAANGANVLIIGRNKEALHQSSKLIDSKKAEGVNIYTLCADLSDIDGIEDVFTQCVKIMGGKVDILVNNAGIQYRCPAKDYPLEKWLQIINVNLNAVFAFAKAAGNHMIKRGNGKIINIASMTSYFGSEMIPAYSASKGAIMQLTKALSNEWMQFGVNVNAIAPGYMETELTQDMKSKNLKQYEEVTGRIPAKRWGKPSDLVGTLIFLSSDASNYVSGAIIPVDGGYLGK